MNHLDLIHKVDAVLIKPYSYAFFTPLFFELFFNVSDFSKRGKVQKNAETLQIFFGPDLLIRTKLGQCGSGLKPVLNLCES